MEGPSSANAAQTIAIAVVNKHKALAIFFFVFGIASLIQTPQLLKRVKDQADMDPSGPTIEAMEQFHIHFPTSSSDTESILIRCSRCRSLVDGEAAIVVREIVESLNSTLFEVNRTEAPGWITNIMTYYDIPTFINPNPYIDDEKETMLFQWRWVIPDGKDDVAGQIADRIVEEEKGKLVTGRAGLLNITIWWGGALATHRDSTEANNEEPKHAASALIVLIPILALRVRSISLVSITLLCVMGAIATACSIVSIIANYISVYPMALSVICFFSCALSMDYSLFMLSRYSEERRAGASWRPACVNMVANSGRVVLVSGLVLFAAGLSGTVLPGSFKGMALAIAAACFSAMVWNILLTPALIASCPECFDFGSGWGRGGRIKRQETQFASDDAVEDSLKSSPWYWWTSIITVWPVNIAIVIIVLVMGLPLLVALCTYVPTIDFALAEPRGASSSIANALIREKFAAGPGCPNPLLVLVKPKPADACPATVRSNGYFQSSCDLAQRIITGTEGKPYAVSSKDIFGAMFHPKFGAVDSSKVVCMPYRHEEILDFDPDAYSLLSGNGFFTGDTEKLRNFYKSAWEHAVSKDEDATLLIIVPRIDSTTPEGYGLVDDVRNIIAKKVSKEEHDRAMRERRRRSDGDGDTSVLQVEEEYCELDSYLLSAASVTSDFKDSSYSQYPYSMLCTVLPAFVMVGFLFGAYFVPVKLMLTVAMPTFWSYGLVILVYQYGMLDGLGISSLQKNTGMQWSLPVMCFPFLLGLGLDYDLIVFDRIWEFRADGYCNEDAIRLGVASMGGTITAAGAIFTLEMAGMLLSPIATVNEFGLLLIASVLIDIIFVETCLVPALLSLRADLNWYPQIMPPPTRFLNEKPETPQVDIKADGGDTSRFAENVPFLLDTDDAAEQGVPPKDPSSSTVPSKLHGETKAVPYKTGDRIKVWSNSKKDWLDAVVEEVFESACYYEGYAITPGTVKVKWSSGAKFVRFDEFEKMLRLADDPDYSDM